MLTKLLVLRFIASLFLLIKYIDSFLGYIFYNINSSYFFLNDN